MMKKIKQWFTNTCHQCQEPLLAEVNMLCCTKSCIHGHYREETYHQLGVCIVYEE